MTFQQLPKQLRAYAQSLPKKLLEVAKGFTQNFTKNFTKNFAKNFTKNFNRGVVYQKLQHAAYLIQSEFRLRDELVYCICEGNLPHQGGRLVVHYLGRKRFANDFLVFYDRDAVDAALRQSMLYSTHVLHFLQVRQRTLACPSDADILLIDGMFDGLFKTDAVVLAPHLNAVLPVEPTLEAQLQRIRSKGHRRKIQSALKRGFHWRQTHSAADFNFFYDVMYAPFVHNRFRYGASLVPRSEMQRIFNRRGFLLFVEEAGQPVSGAFMYTSLRYPGTLHYWKYGLAHATTLTPAAFGDRNAITEAMVLQYAVNKKFKELDFGLTRALPWDGIFAHKKRLGCDFRKSLGTPLFRLYINPPSQVRLLSRFPLIVFEQQHMRCWLAQEDLASLSTPETLQEGLQACTFPSAQSIELFTPAAVAESPLLAQALASAQQSISIPIRLRYLSHP